MPSPDYQNFNTEIDQLFALNTRIIIASIISYFCSEPLNSIVLSRLKIKLQGRYLPLRFIRSTVIASGVNSLIFSCLAFYGSIPNHVLLQMIFTVWLSKIAIEVLGLPLSTFLAKKLKQKENLDIYDWHTNYNLFHWDAQYSTKNNAR